MQKIMISLISVKNIASYDSYGIQFSDLKKVNFIYGANGSGKTTLSNLLADPTISDFNDSDVKWEHEHKLPTLVYNKAFREKNFGSGKIAGVFTLGEATKEEIETIEKKKKELSELEDIFTQKKATLKKQRDKKNG